jgi:heme-degrading monooxygenase HmoA
MFGRQVTMKLKADSATELTRLNDSEIIPLLRRQKGFRDETTFISAERKEAVVNTFWDTREEAEAYNTTSYSEVLKTLSHVIEGTPIVATFEFANSTFHKTAAAGLA